jgi:glycerophosphoryl diester phosphodiesterase
VVSRDGVLIVRHENELSGTTDVADRFEFAARRTRKTIDGRLQEGWFAEDFDLAELKTLRCRERLPELRSTAFDGEEPILTFEELVGIAREGDVGLMIELKHPAYFRSIGLELEPRLMAAVAHAGVPVFIECFEPEGLRRLAGARRPRIQLIAAEGAPDGEETFPYADMLTTDGLRDITRWAEAISVEKSLLDPSLIARASALGLKVFAWTFRAENAFLPPDLRRGDDPAAHGDMAEELRRARALGVDGVFCDFPGLARAALG